MPDATIKTMSDIRSRLYSLVLYPDEDPSHVFSLNTLAQGGFQYFCLDHTKDIYCEKYDPDHSHLWGTPKKKHTHVLVSLKNPRYLTAFAKTLNLPPQYLQPSATVDGAVLYFAHVGREEKCSDGRAYEPECFYGPLASVAVSILAGGNESDRVLGLIRLLDSMPKPCSYRSFIMAACSAGYYSDLRRMGYLAKELIAEHNGWGTVDNQDKYRLGDHL